MKRSVRAVEIASFASEVRPEIVTESAAFAEAIAWADERPAAWSVVMGAKSKAWGRHSSRYMGCDRGSLSAPSVLARLLAFRDAVGNVDGQKYPERPGTDFVSWSAAFTLEHYDLRGFASGHFQEHNVWPADGKEYGRHSSTLDFTPTTLESVIDRFVAWCDRSCPYEGRTRVTLDGKDVRTFAKSSATP